MNRKYYNIYNDILSKIESNLLKPNTKLPSEHDLMKEYDVSRATIRYALDLLEQNGYINKIKGKGSFVLDINKFDFPVSGLISFKELNERMDLKANTIIKEFELIKPNNYLMKQLNISDNEHIWKVIRAREINNKKIILDKDYFNKEFVPSLTEDICRDSIYKYLENELGLKISYAKKEITVQLATEEDKKYLDLENYDMIVVVKTYVYLDDMSLFQYGESRHRPDKFKFVDFARRNY